MKIAFPQKPGRGAALQRRGRAFSGFGRMPDFRSQKQGRDSASQPIAGLKPAEQGFELRFPRQSANSAIYHLSGAVANFVNPIWILPNFGNLRFVHDIPPTKIQLNNQIIHALSKRVRVR
jgi:hypothetical protein